MSRIYRPFRALFKSARITSRYQSGQNVRIERVKVKKAKTTTRFLGTVIKGVLAYQLLMWAIQPAPAEKAGRKPRDLADEDEEPQFIPFPLTTKVHPEQPYAASDPEWREFVRISRDPKLQSAIRQIVAGTVLKAAAVTPRLVMQAGGDFQIKRHWMDIDFPYKAPPVYERSGILLTDEAIEWATMPCDPWLAKQLERVLWPKPVALGFWAFSTAMAKQTALGVARYFGFASEDPSSTQAGPIPQSPSPLPSSPGPEVQKALQQIRRQATRRPEEVNDPGSMAASSSAPSSAPSATPSTPREKGITLPDKLASDQSKQDTPEQKSLTKESVQLIANSQPWNRFKETYVRERPVTRVPPPRGSIFISGLIELETSRCWVVIDVFTWYDPKKKGLAPGCTRMFVRRVENKRKSAMRP